MSYELQIIENQKAIQKMLNDSKNINQLDELINLLAQEDLLSLFSKSEDKTVKISISTLLQMFVSSVGYLFSEKQTIIFKANQTVYNLPSRPNNIDLYKKGQWQIESVNYDHSYDALTGNITIINQNNVDTEYEYRSFGKYSVKQTIIVGSNNQVLFNYSSSPANIDVYYEGQILKENVDFTRTKLSEGNSITIINPDLIQLIKAGKTLEIRKF